MHFSISNFDTSEIVDSKIVAIFSFPNNDPDHLISIYESGKIREYLTKPLVDIGEYYMDRPVDEFLSSNGHHLVYDNPKVSKILVFENLFFIGYEDGLILVWAQQAEKNPNCNKIVSEQDENIINELNEIYQKKYYNIYDLDLIFIGHSDRIIELYYLDSRNLLFSSSEDLSVRIWDLSKGVSIYAFNFDSQINRFLTVTDKKSQIVSFFSRDYHKLNLNISKEPFIFSTNTFKHNSEKEFIFYDNRYYLTGSRSNIIILDANLNDVLEVNDYNSSKFLYLKKYKNFFVTVSDDNSLKLSEIKEQTLEIKPFIKYNFGKNDIIFMDIIKENLCFVVTRDKKIHKIELSKEIELFEERKRMREEDKLSIQFNMHLRAKSSKKKPTSGKKKPGTASSKSTDRAKSAKKSTTSAANPKSTKSDNSKPSKSKDAKKKK